jgi:peptidoglycan hydrolase CwlO-like protein
MKRLILLFFTLVFIIPSLVFAEACSDISDPNQRITCLNGELDRLGSQSKTLSNQIAQFDAQIKLATIQIAQTEQKISLLGGRINQLEISLEALTKAFASRAVETYRMSRVGSGFILLLSSDSLSEATSRFHYLQLIQKADQELLSKLQIAQTDYKGQKEDQETLQKQLQIQKTNLANQKSAKTALLTATRNDEKRYQQLLSEAIAQLNISKGLGEEKFLRNISEGETIGAIINSPSGCSTGRHLHFQVQKDNNLQDPNDYLKSIGFNYSYPSNLYSYFGTINPHGSWNWPMNEPITINQGYGSTGYARDFGYQNFVHPGIDLESSSSQVKAVASGKLYSGSINCGGKYPGVLPYAKVEQDNGIVIYYEHMYVQ